MIKLRVKSILGIKKTIGQREIEISISEGTDLSGLLSEMVNRFGKKLSSQLFEPGTQNPLPHIRIMVNGRDIAFLDKLETVLNDGDEVLLFPPVSGG